MYIFNAIIKNVNVKTDLATTNNTNNRPYFSYKIYIVHTHINTWCIVLSYMITNDNI